MPSTASTIFEGGGVTQNVNVVNSPEIEVKNDVGNPIPVTIPTPVPITDNSGSLTVDGSVAVTNFPATQPVSGTVAVSNFPASQPVTGTFFQTTQPISAATLPLPSGASTEATLALIKAKTDNLDVLLSTRTKPTDSQVVSTGPSLISTSLNPGWPIGTVGYYQTGLNGESKGLLLALTNTPLYLNVIMTDHGLRRLY